MLKASPKSLVFFAFIVMLGIFIGFYAWLSFDLRHNLHNQQTHSTNRLLISIAILTICFLGLSMWWLLQQINQKDNFLVENHSYIDIIQGNNASIKILHDQEHLMAESLKQINELLEEKVNSQTELIKEVFERIKQVFIGTNAQFNVVYANGKVGELFGNVHLNLLEQSLLPFLKKIAGNELLEMVQSSFEKQERITYEFLHPLNNNWHEVRLYPSTNGMSFIIRNINTNKLNELALQKSRQMYEFISKANEIILHAQHADIMFSQICDLSVSYKDILFTWIGTPNTEDHSIKPQFWAGHEAGYLTVIKSISTIDSPAGRGPSGKAIREGHHYYCNDIQNDPSMEIWRDEAISRGYRSSIALPIKTNGKVVALLTIYASKAFYFTNEQVGLLLNVSENISFALQAFHTEGQRKLTELQLHKLSQAIEQSSASIVITNIEGIIEYVNPAFCNLTGYSLEESIGQNPKILKTGITPDDEYLQLWTNLAKKKNWHGEFCNKKKNGDLYWEYAVISPIINQKGEVTNYVAVKENITERKRLQEDQQRMTVDLLQRNKDLEQFSYMLSHNIRGPLTNILGLLAAVRGGLMQLEDVLIIEGITTSANTMDLVIKDVTEILQIKKFSIESKEDLDLNLTFELAKKNLYNLIVEKEAIIETDFATLNQVYTIKTYLENIFYHLILNALKFTKPGQTPQIRIWSEKSNTDCLIHFRDQGIGIDLGKHSVHLFRLYKKLNHNIEGRGTGLFMVKTQLEFMGGSIQVFSNPGLWTEFLISLPLKAND